MEMEENKEKKKALKFPKDSLDKEKWKRLIVVLESAYFVS